jgi:hypothetical protein
MSSADLVGRLLDRADHYLPDWADAAMREAAAEIERQARIIAAHQQQVKDGAALIEEWKSRALKIEAETREACAKIAETAVGPEAFYISHQTYRLPADGRQIATAIRASASTPKEM